MLVIASVAHVGVPTEVAVVEGVRADDVPEAGIVSRLAVDAALEPREPPKQLHPVDARSVAVPIFRMVAAEAHEVWRVSMQSPEPGVGRTRERDVEVDQFAAVPIGSGECVELEAGAAGRHEGH